MAFEHARPIEGAVATAGVDERMTFLKKTYGHLAGAIGLFVLLEYLFIPSELGMRWVFWAATGWAFGYTCYGVGRHLSLQRYVWLGASGGLASTLVLFLPFSFGVVSLLFWCSWGLILFASGGIALRKAFQPEGSLPDDR